MAISLTLLIPLWSCIASAVFAGSILDRDSSDRVHRIAAFLVAGTSFWAFCEINGQVQSDPAVVLAWVRASALGWVWIGPASLHLLLAIDDAPLPRLRRALPVLYGISGLILVLDWTTPWIHPAVVRAEWGWAYTLGPGSPVLFAHAGAGLIGAAAIGWRRFLRAPSPEKRGPPRWLIGAIPVPIAVALLTDALLPLAGVQVPRLGAASFAVLGGVIAWCFRRYDHSLLAPDRFAGEILETLPTSVAMLWLDGTIRSANAAMARLLVGSTDPLGGVRLTDRLEGFSGDLAEEVSDQHCEIVAATGAREPVSISSSMLRDRRGTPIGLVVVARDLAEVVSLRKGLLLSGRLAAVGELAAGIVHEINNPLAYLRANLNLLRQHWQALGGKVMELATSPETSELLGEGEELIDESLEGVEHAAAIVRDVRGLAHAGRGQWESADLHRLLDGVIRMAAPQLTARASIEKCYASIPPIFCAPQELQQVFLNLVLNAGQAIQASGTIRVITERDRGAVIVRVEDDGCGIDSKVLGRIFDPFYTTKPVGTGTGLGLGIAYEIVRRHGGEITVESELGAGASFRVRLPVSADTLPD